MRSTRALGSSTAVCLVMAGMVAQPVPSEARHAVSAGTFADDDGNVHEAMIEAIAAEGVTGGCAVDPPRYCPARKVTRGEMAAFLARAFDLPAASRDHFDDDDGTTHEVDINRVAEAGITAGYSDGTFRPGWTVNRQQMATFLATAMGLEPVPGDRFEDVSGPHEPNINAIADAGVTRGCEASGTRFCPSDPVRRAVMASFLGRALGLDPVEPAGPVLRASFAPIVPSKGHGQGPDTAIAVGQDVVVSITNSLITISDIHGSMLVTSTTRDFWAPAGVADETGATVADPHVIYDATSGRFFIVEKDGAAPGCQRPCPAYQLLAVSRTSAPKGLKEADWHFYALDRSIDRAPGGTIQTGDVGDRDYLAADQNALVIASADYDPDTGRFRGANVRILEKQPLLAGQAPTTWRDLGEVRNPRMEQEEILLFPLATNDGSGRFYLISEAGQCAALAIWALDDPLGSPSLEYQHASSSTVPSGCVGPIRGLREPTITQPDGGPPIATMGVVESGSYHDGTIWTVTGRVAEHPSGEVNGFEWMQVDVGSWPEPTVVQSGLSSAPDVHRWVAAGVGDANDNFGVVYLQSSESEYPSLYVAHRLGRDPAGELREPVLLKQGNTVTTSNIMHTPDGEFIKFADYQGASLDPVDGSMWFIGQYADSSVHRETATWAVNLSPGGKSSSTDDGPSADEEQDTTDGPRFVLGPDVTADDEALARDALEEGITGLEDRTGYAARDIDVFVFADADRIADAYCEYRGLDPCDSAKQGWQTRSATAMLGAIFVRTDHDMWTGEARPTMHQEYIGALQWELAAPAAIVADGDVIPPAGPLWMSGGQTTYLQTLLRYPDTYPFARAQMRENARYDDPDRPTLESLSGTASFQDNEGQGSRLGHFAVYVLLEDFDADLADLFAYYHRIGQGTAWQTAFAETFGVAIDEFYTHFEDL